MSTDDVEARPSLTSLEKAASLLRQGVHKAGLFASLFPQSSSYAQLGQRMLYLFVRNTIVCLDDLERAGNGLNMKDVLGLASQLKDEKGCKVVILLNDEKLTCEAKSDFQEQLEKVVDVVIDFELSPKEAINIALDTSTVFYEILRDNCAKLKIDNIRVIKKAEQFCARLVPLLSNFDGRVLHQAVHTATLACFAKYQPDKAPSFAFIRSFDPWDASIRVVNGDKSQVNPDYLTIQEYGITSIDGLDEVVLRGVERGFVDEDQLNVEAMLVNNNLSSSDMKADYHRAWEIYRSSFARNEEIFANALIQAVERNISIIDPPNLNSAVSVLREMGFEKSASDLITFFMSNKDEKNPSCWDLNNFDYGRRIQDNEIASAFAMRFQSIQIPTDPVLKLKKIAERDSWNDKDEVEILQLSEERVAKIFLEAEDEDLSLVISAYRRFLSISNPSPNLSEICRRAKVALRTVADVSKLNKMRVKSIFYDVDLEI